MLEIGPGIGTLTQHLCENSGHVLAIEIDRRLIPILEETLSDYDNVTILNEDILKVDIASLVKDYNDNKPVKIVANLPYYITTPIIMDIFEKHIPLSGVTVMIQKRWRIVYKQNPVLKITVRYLLRCSTMQNPVLLQMFLQIALCPDRRLVQPL